MDAPQPVRFEAKIMPDDALEDSLVDQMLQKKEPDNPQKRKLDREDDQPLWQEIDDLAEQLFLKNIEDLGNTIKCRKGLWSVSGPDRQYVLAQARHYFYQYYLAEAVMHACERVPHRDRNNRTDS